MEQNILSTPELSPLEQEVLEEYERLAGNMKQAVDGEADALVCVVGECAGRPCFEPVDGNTGWAAGPGAQDEPGVYAAQGERVQHSAATGD
ncbi:hypothetical protein MHUMG1_00804 [Metarhizium humberi]|uniref:Uncharacterized protein n=1 Tax=Metarhizium humberi TaxID=2596975 RepID=A0A9P8MKD7_9HYPO|nr:hypothetical protein MHUMG1_00804 [Metarhizium humberi]